MPVGLIVRSGTVAINAGLIFLLAQRAPQLGWSHVSPQSPLFKEVRDTLLPGLARVRTDLETNGRLPIWVRTAQHPPTDTEGPAPGP
jgi:hypothetical protein